MRCRRRAPTPRVLRRRTSAASCCRGRCRLPMGLPAGRAAANEVARRARSSSAPGTKAEQPRRAHLRGRSRDSLGPLLDQVGDPVQLLDLVAVARQIDLDHVGHQPQADFELAGLVVLLVVLLFIVGALLFLEVLGLLLVLVLIVGALLFLEVLGLLLVLVLILGALVFLEVLGLLLGLLLVLGAL